MDGLVARIQEFFKRLLAILELLQRLVAAIKRHPRTTAGIVLVLLVYLSLHWYTFNYPARTIDSFYVLINTGRANEAWDLLNPPYHRRWSNKRQTFAAGFRTTQSHQNVVVEFDGYSFNPASLLVRLFSRSIEYDVSFVAIDRFTKTDCEQKEQEYDCRWLQVSDPAHYEQLMDGTLAVPEASSDPTLELKRYYKKKFTLYRVSVWSWLISQIDTPEVGLKR